MCAVHKHKLLHHQCLSQFFQSTAFPHYISQQVLSSQSIVSSSRTVRPCNPWGGRWIGHWKTTWSVVWSSVPHSHAAEVAIPHLCKQEQKCPTPVRRHLSLTHAVSGTTRNFFLGGSITWCTTYCSFHLFPNNWKLVWNTSENLSKFVSGGGPWPLRPHSGCTTAHCSWQCHSRKVGWGWQYRVL